MAERIDARLAVVGWHLVGFGHADPRSQARDALVRDGALGHNAHII
jgi:hypothetical protein